jgi:sensor histidine kinase YesM
MPVHHIKDRAVKTICIPLLGVFIPNITGLINNGAYNSTGIVVSYLYFIFVALIIWEGNVKLMYRIKEKIVWQYTKYPRIILSVFFANIFYSGILSGAMLYGWKIFSNETSPGFQPIARTSLVIIVLAVFITNIYELISLNDEKELTLSRVEQLNSSKAQAELEALKNQLDPHFIFNSLNTLSFLITNEPNSAVLFNDTLAKVYRYILTNKENDLVLLKEEIEFIGNYFYLMRIRFRDAINLEIEINDVSADDYLIPPISLQALVENAIKHNDFSEAMPLTIYISVTSNNIVVKNTVQPKTSLQPGQKSGLLNLGHRFQLITKRNVIIENKNNTFSVRLPILKF